MLLPRVYIETLELHLQLSLSFNSPTLQSLHYYLVNWILAEDPSSTKSF